jgi:hypothetical protein
VVSELHYANNEVTFNGQKMTVEQFIGFVMESRCDERRAVIIRSPEINWGSGIAHDRSNNRTPGD